ncbi:MAG: hypothetical protein HYV07_20960 [Deltaproteobacteria bacterium]|nr:hypothetical protein [Deltaproteobacteria bacterium]
MRTFWHLEGRRRAPRDYEIVSTGLLYHPARGLSVETPVKAWLQRHVQGSAFCVEGLAEFQDPRGTTYSTYVELQRSQQSYLDGMLDRAERGDRDDTLDPDWLEELRRSFAPLRYPCHALQMTAAYLGQMAPDSRLTIAFLFQAADEMRRVSGLARRLGQLVRAHGLEASGARGVFEADERWQPFRALFEGLLVTYDYGAAFCALQLVVKPYFEAVLAVFAAMAKRRSDRVGFDLVHAFDDDVLWHRAWSDVVIRIVLRDDRAREAIRRWVSDWRIRAEESARTFAEALDPEFGGARIGIEIGARVGERLAALGLVDASPASSRDGASGAP